MKIPGSIKIGGHKKGKEVKIKVTYDSDLN